MACRPNGVPFGSGAGAVRSWSTVPWRRWGGLVVIAVGGSCLYGASLSLVVRRWDWRGGAGWVALSAGVAWCVFGPALVWLTRRNPWTLAHACLVTMAAGEGVLTVGALLNALARVTGRAERLPMARLNGAWVGLSNVVMAAALARQLKALGVPVRLTLAAWFGVLDGAGAILFWWLARRLGPGSR